MIMKGCCSGIITMTGWTDDMVCCFFFWFCFLRKIKEGVVNKHPSTCSGVG